VPDDVGEWFARGATGDERVVALTETRRRFLIAVSEVALRRPPEQMLGEQTRIEVGFVGRDARIA